MPEEEAAPFRCPRCNSPCYFDGFERRHGVRMRRVWCANNTDTPDEARCWYEVWEVESGH